MPDFSKYKSIPIGSIATLPLAEGAVYNDRIVQLPSDIFEMLASPKTGAFIRGEAKSLGLSTADVPRISFQLIRLFLGEITPTELPQALTTQSIPPQAAQALARTIERELVAQHLIQMQTYLSKQKPTLLPNPTVNTSGPSNLLNLKNTDHRPGPSSLN